MRVRCVARNISFPLGSTLGPLSPSFSLRACMVRIRGEGEGRAWKRWIRKVRGRERRRKNQDRSGGDNYVLFLAFLLDLCVNSAALKLYRTLHQMQLHSKRQIEVSSL